MSIYGNTFKRLTPLLVFLIVVISIVVSYRYTSPGLLEFSPKQKSSNTSRLIEGNYEDIIFSDYADAEFGISFEYPSSWSIRKNIYHEESLRELEIASKQGYITIEKLTQTEELTPSQWFENNRENYSDLMAEVGEVKIGGKPTLLIAQAGTCRTAPLLAAIISFDNRILLISHYELASRPSAPEFGHLLETLSFRAPPGNTSLPTVYFEFPQPPSDLVCP